MYNVQGENMGTFINVVIIIFAIIMGIFLLKLVLGGLFSLVIMVAPFVLIGGIGYGAYKLIKNISK